MGYVVVFIAGLGTGVIGTIVWGLLNSTIDPEVDR